jgi:ubiquinone/menaquinone biosynthesis C-methylase UbiE
MPQNIYDDPRFFAGYKHLRDTDSGLNDVLEQPALHALLPDPKDLSILELGCGMGQFARWCAENGASNVLGTDISRNMLQVAEKENAHPNVGYKESSLETLELPDSSFDLVVSSLALHYVEDYDSIVERVFRWLRSGGLFVYSTEHPICTADVKAGGWGKDASGKKLFWPVDNYGDEGKREQTWFVEGVVKYHRKVSTLLNGLTKAGFVLEQITEPEAIPEALATRPSLSDERRRPPFILIRARKP